MLRHRLATLLLKGMKLIDIYTRWSDSWGFCLPAEMIRNEAVECYFCINYKFRKLSPNEPFMLCMLNFSEVELAISCYLFLYSEQEVVWGSCWSFKRNSVSGGVLPRGRTHKWFVLWVSRHFQVLESEGIGWGRGLELGSLCDAATISTQWKLVAWLGGKDWLKSQLCNLFIVWMDKRQFTQAHSIPAWVSKCN